MLYSQSLPSKPIFLLVLLANSAKGMEEPADWEVKQNKELNRSYPPASSQHDQALRQPTFNVRAHTDIISELSETQISQLYDSCDAGLRRRIDALSKNSKRNKIYNNRFILEGPTGSAKSSLAKAIAYRCQCSYLFVVGTELADEYKDSARTYIDALLKALDILSCDEQRKALIIDEIDSFTDKYNNTNDGDSGAVQYFWSQLDKFDKKNIIVIGTTNNFKRIPTQIKGRFRTSFHVDLPSMKLRTTLLESMLSDICLNRNMIPDIAKKMDRFSLREIENFIGFIHEKLDTESDEYVLNDKDIQEALQRAVKDHKKNVESDNEDVLNKKWHHFNTRYLPLIGVCISSGIAISGLAIQYYITKENNTKLIELQNAHHKAQMQAQEVQHQKSLAQQDDQFKKSYSQNSDFHSKSLYQSAAIGIAPLTGETAGFIFGWWFPGAGEIVKNGVIHGTTMVTASAPYWIPHAEKWIWIPIKKGCTFTWELRRYIPISKLLPKKV